MERLTERYVTTSNEKIVWVHQHDYIGASERLAEYEDTGLTPEQIQELKERDTEYFCKTSMFDHESVVCKCGNDIEKDSGFKFCPYCGHRIKLGD